MKADTTVKIAMTWALVGAGCAAALPPPELLAARSAYTTAQRGTAAKLAPAELHTAGQALRDAERAFKDDVEPAITRDLAYVAERRAQIAQARGDALQSQQNETKAAALMQANQAERAKSTSAELTQAKESLASEREARVAADRRASQAAADLAKVASVKQEPRGMVITLSGSVLFASSKSDLLADARSKLDSVAQTLTQQAPDSKMVVEGYTDSRGTVPYNQELSQRRAEAVRSYLVSRGIASDRVSSKGFGSERAIADNGSAEGRANNRRVEIVIENASDKAR